MKLLAKVCSALSPRGSCAEAADGYEPASYFMTDTLLDGLWLVPNVSAHEVNDLVGQGAPNFVLGKGWVYPYFVDTVCCCGQVNAWTLPDDGYSRWDF